MSHASTTTKRLLREASLIASTPSNDYYAAPVSDSNLHEWHFTLRGPSQTPYENGLYHGRITLPSQYPLKPPSFRFLTPSGRFECNREICLSISNFHEESWNPAWDVRTALTALRPFMAAEPEGQVGGVRASAEVRKRLAGESRGWRCYECEGKRMDQILGIDEDSGREVKVLASPLKDGDNIPALKFGYKDEMGKVSKPSVSTTDANIALTPPATPNTSEATNISSQAPAAAAAVVAGGSTAAEATLQRRTSSTSTNTRPVSSTPASEVQSHPPSVWLDAAIAGVVVMLIVLVLRRLAAAIA